MPQTYVVPYYPPFPYNLGQDAPQLVDSEPAETIAEMYARLQDWCAQNIGPETCKKILPAEPIWLPPPAKEGFGLPWWAWGIIGFLGAKILRL